MLFNCFSAFYLDLNRRFKVGANLEKKNIISDKE